MRTKRWLILGILVCLLSAGGAYMLATHQIDSLYAYRSLLRNNPPAPGPALGQPLTRRVVFVLVDALRVDTAANPQVMPALQQLREQGAWATVHSQTPSYSEPGYAVLLTGAWPDISDGPAMNLDYADIPTFTQDNIFSAAGRAGIKTAISGYYWFEKLVPQAGVSFHFYTPGEDRTADEEVLAAALPWLKDPMTALVLIHIDQVDYAGHHEGGPRDVRWDQAASRADQMIQQITAQLDLSKDTLLVVSDHGQINQGGHGGQEPVTLVEPFLLVGAGVKPGQAADIQQVDIAPTVAALLGLNVPASAEGQVVTDVLNLPAGRIEQIQAAEKEQQDQLWAAYQQALGSSGTSEQSTNILRATEFASLRNNRLAGQRLPRLAAALVALLIVSGFLVKFRSRALWVMVLCGLLYMLVFNLKYAFLDEKTYSFSSVTGASGLLASGVINALIGMAAGWALQLTVQQLFKEIPGVAASRVIGMTLVIIFLVSLPVLFNFVWNGPWVTWTLPEPLSYFLALLSSIQILAIAVIGLVLAGITGLWAGIVQRRSQLSS